MVKDLLISLADEINGIRQYGCAYMGKKYNAFGESQLLMISNTNASYTKDI